MQMKLGDIKKNKEDFFISLMGFTKCLSLSMLSSSCLGHMCVTLVTRRHVSQNWKHSRAMQMNKEWTSIIYIL